MKDKNIVDIDKCPLVRKLIAKSYNKPLNTD